MTERDQLIEVFDARAKRRDERRDFFKAALGAAAAGGAFMYATEAAAQANSDVDILNFALNLEYLEANFYSYAVFGTPISPTLTTGGVGTLGAATATGATGPVPFQDIIVRQYAREIANDEIAHVNFLRTAITQAAGASAVAAQPRIDVGVTPTGAFSSAARAAGLPLTNNMFNPYASDENFLLGAFIFEDVGVTAYKGSAALINTAAYLEAAAGILAVEAYHAALVRTVIYRKGLDNPALRLIEASEAISGARDSLDGSSDVDQGVAEVNGASNIVPVDSNALAFSRTAAQTLNIVYLNRASVQMGGFFPAGVNGTIKASAAN